MNKVANMLRKPRLVRSAAQIRSSLLSSRTVQRPLGVRSLATTSNITTPPPRVSLTLARMSGRTWADFGTVD